MKRIVLFTLLIGFYIMLQAQECSCLSKSSNKNKLIQLDIDAGASLDLANRQQGNMLTALTDKGAVFPAINFRMHHFFSKNFGWYANLRVDIPRKYERDCSAELTQLLENEYYVKNHYDARSRPMVTPCFDLGVAYRIENARWAFYPRVGVGVSYVEIQEVNLDLKKKGSNELYRVYYDNGDPDQTGGNLMNIEMFILSAGFSVNYKLSRHCHLLLNASYTQPVGTFNCLGHVVDSYTNERIKESKYRSSTIGRNLNVSVGVGFPIYLGRKEVGFKRKQKASHSERMRRLMDQKRKSYGLFPGNK